MKKTYTVLVVDDNEAQGYATGRLLENAGYSVLRAQTGGTGLRIACETPPDVVLLDINLPDVNGVSVAHQLRTRPETRKASIVLYSATSSPSEGLDERAREAGAFLTVPFEPDHLLHVVKGALARAGKTRENP
jgi:CheY-like chemotaxis protein